LTGKTQIIPTEAAIDEKHLPVRATRAACAGPNGVRRLADQQGFIAGDQVDPGQTLGQCRGQLLGA
jgi:hypothetical protein